MSTKNDILRRELKIRGPLFPSSDAAKAWSETIESAIAYHVNRDAEQLAVVIKGVIRRYADKKHANVAIDETMRLKENLGFGWMSTRECITTLHKIFEFDVETTNKEEKQLLTVGDVMNLTQKKAKGVGVSAPAEESSPKIEEIKIEEIKIEGINLADFGPIPTDYEERVKTCRDNLKNYKDPMSMQFDFEQRVLRRAVTGGGWFDIPKTFGWVVAVNINAKNSTGGYNGFRKEYYMLKPNGETLIITERCENFAVTFEDGKLYLEW